MSTGIGLAILGYFIFIGLVWHNQETSVSLWLKTVVVGLLLLVVLVGLATFILPYL